MRRSYTGAQDFFASFGLRSTERPETQPNRKRSGYRARREVHLLTFMNVSCGTISVQEPDTHGVINQLVTELVQQLRLSMPILAKKSSFP